MIAMTKINTLFETKKYYIATRFMLNVLFYKNAAYTSYLKPF